MTNAMIMTMRLATTMARRSFPVTQTVEQSASVLPPFSVVVPTFREAAGLRALAERVRDALAGGGREWELLLMDDDSCDGSEEVAAEIGRRLPVRMHVRREPPRDLSLSVLLGIRLARFDRVVVMDADLSHPPERIPDLLAALDAGADLVLGSRYVPGASVDRGWSRHRRSGSRLATALARPLVTCADPLSGFFAADRRTLPVPEPMRPIGFKLALELMVRGRLRVAEVPIVFHDRHIGESKMGWRTLAAYLRQLVRLYGFRVARAMLRRGRRARRFDEHRSHRRVPRPWGSYETVHEGGGFKVKHITVRPGHRLSLQSHRRRAEHWIVVRGVARVTRDGETFSLRENESTFIPRGARHRLDNPGEEPLELVEVQAGDYLGEDDIVRFDDDYGRLTGEGEAEREHGTPMTQSRSAAYTTPVTPWIETMGRRG